MNLTTRARCLAVDDEPHLRQAVVRLVAGAGHQCREAGSGPEALRELEREPADLVISDIRMPEMDGTELLAIVRARWPDTGVMMVTGVADVETAVRCLQLGALDYIVKPFQLEEARVRVVQALEKRRLILEVRDYRLHLEQRVQQQALRIEKMFVEAVQTLAQALEAKDAYTRGHSQRVAAYATAIAGQQGLDPATRAEIRLGGELHDVGKIG
ncbi:MAG: response regulator, partial [Gemmatimonadetes bacterium]|nr:response regulator [Gemmatimonadota bacterium]